MRNWLNNVVYKWKIEQIRRNVYLPRQIEWFSLPRVKNAVLRSNPSVSSWDALSGLSRAHPGEALRCRAPGYLTRAGDEFVLVPWSLEHPEVTVPSVVELQAENFN